MATPKLKTAEGKGLGFYNIIQQLCEAIDTPHSLALSMLLTAGKEEDIISAIQLPFSPGVYLEKDAQKFASDYLLTKLCSKMPNILGRDLHEAAIASFEAAERSCLSSNLSLLSGVAFDQLFDRTSVTLEGLRRAIKRIVGRAPSLLSCGEAGGWGPGSNLELSRAEATPEAKCGTVSITYKLCKELERSGVWTKDHQIPDWLLGPYKLVPGNMITTVPKNAKTDRTIAIEPAVNSWFQKGVGSFLRKRLRRFGIDLNDQTINQRLASLAQSFGFATLDLSAASDSIAMLLVELLFPDEWVYLIQATRSERGTYSSRNDVLQGVAEWFDYQKVSSMGNGFTFELESVIFTAVCLACGVPEYDIFVYGDDIIVPQEKAHVVAEALACLGFSLNQEKSFLQGCFFESCGVHVFNGCDVTPFSIKEIPHGPKDYMHFANELRLFATRLGAFGCSVRQFKPVYNRLVRQIPQSLKARGPVGGGICLFSNYDEIRNGSKHGRLRYKHLTPEIRFVPSRWQFTCDRVDEQGLPIDRYEGRDLDRTVAREGLGETPFLLQFRLFQLRQNPDYQWDDDLPCISQGNTICRPENRPWTRKERERFSVSDRKLIGNFALRSVTGYVYPGTVRDLTRWA